MKHLTDLARNYVHENSFKKGSPNTISFSFCKWVNNEMLPNNTLELRFPRQVYVEVCRKWLHKMDFQVKKGIYVNGHEYLQQIAQKTVDRQCKVSVLQCFTFLTVGKDSVSVRAIGISTLLPKQDIVNGKIAN